MFGVKSPSMPGVFNLSVDETVREAESAFEMGVQALLLFGLPETKDETATGAYAEKGIVQQAMRAVRRAVPEMVLIADTCLCEYTSHGHCGVVRDGEVLERRNFAPARTHSSQSGGSRRGHRRALGDDGRAGRARFEKVWTTLASST